MKNNFGLTTPAGTLPVVATGNNRTNSQGLFGGQVKNRKSSLFANVLAAGGTLPVPMPGTNFYVIFAGGAIEIRPSGGVFNTYYPGTGLRLEPEDGQMVAFSMLEVRNPNSVPVAFQIFVGFGDFIDKRLILNSIQNPQIAYPTCPTPLVLTDVPIIDLSGQLFNDINNNAWIAVSRVAIVISNLDVGATFLLQKAGSVISNGPAVCTIFPTTSIRLDLGGNYCLNAGGGTINAIVSEIYLAIQPNLTP